MTKYMGPNNVKYIHIKKPKDFYNKVKNKDRTVRKNIMIIHQDLIQFFKSKEFKEKIRPY